jgi:putative peptidoglycan lipid II flippase
VSKHLKNISIVAFLTVISRVLGLLRETLTARVFGTNLLASAFFTAFRLPNLFRRLLAEGSLTAAFVPTLQSELKQRGRAGAFLLLSNVTSWLTVVTSIVVATGMLGFSRGWFASEAGEKWRLAADLTVILFPYLVFVCLAAAFSATLQVLERFTEPALSPIWLNLAMIAALGAVGMNVATTELGKIHWLCAGALVGGFLQMAVPAAVLIREGWRPRIDLTASPQVRSIAALMGPGVAGTAVYQVNQYVSQLLAYQVSNSSASWMNYASRLMELPIGVFAIAISTVVYPLIARHASEGNLDAMAEDYRKGLRLILMINVPAAAGLLLLAEPIIRTIFEHGRFSAADTAMTVPILQMFAVALPFFSIVSLTTRGFYALNDTKTPVKIAGINFLLNVGLSLALMKPMGVVGLALAGTIAVAVQTIVLQRALAKKLPHLVFGPLWPSVAKVAVATVAMGLIVAVGWSILHGARPGRVADYLALGGLIPVAIAAYGATLWLLKIEGRDELEALTGKFRAKFR